MTVQPWLDNARAGYRVRLLTMPGETGGRSFDVEYILKPFAGKNALPTHRHPKYTEAFEIISGHAHYVVGGEERSAGPGDKFVLPANVMHLHPWSVSDEELHFRQTTTSDPADPKGMNATVQAAVTTRGLAAAGKVGKNGKPNILQLAVLAHATMPAAYIAGPPVAVQHILFALLAGIGRLLGYRVAYPEYGVVTDTGIAIG